MVDQSVALAGVADCVLAARCLKVRCVVENCLLFPNIRKCESFRMCRAYSYARNIQQKILVNDNLYFNLKIAWIHFVVSY
jgi:hypothetical protein